METQVHLIITNTELVLSKREYETFRDIQSDFADYVTSLGPWSTEEAIDFLSFEYPNLLPSAEEQVKELILSPHFEIVLKEKSE